jgi:hypothetical protein
MKVQILFKNNSKIISEINEKSIADLYKNIIENKQTVVATKDAIFNKDDIYLIKEC